jgi:hypothetical protein
MKTPHLDNNHLTGFLYRTLDDAERDNINAHLLNCPICRDRLAEQERYQRNISNELSAEVNRASPSSRMTFAGVAGQLNKHRPISTFWHRLEISLPVAMALGGLLLAMLDIWQSGGLNVFRTQGYHPGVFPTLACFLFMLTSVGEFDKAFTIQPRMIALVLVAAILWLGSAFIGLLNIIIIRDLAIMATISVGGRAAEAGLAAIMAVIVAGMLYIGMVIGGAEYHYRNIGQPGSWKLFSITLLGQLFILILPYLIV